MNDIYFPVRFYDSEEMTAPERVECSDILHGEYFCTPRDYIPPFQVSYETASAVLVSCRGVDFPSPPFGISFVTQTDTVEIEGVEVTRVSHEGGDYGDVPAGLYRIQLFNSLGAQVGVSDPILFYEENSLDYDPVTIRYRGTAGRVLGGMYFYDGLWAQINVNTVEEKPEYPVITESRQDGEAQEHRLFQRWEKRKRLRFKGVESMCDAMSVLPLMEEVYIGGVRVYNVITNITWDEEHSCLADIDITYSVDHITRSF